MEYLPLYFFKNKIFGAARHAKEMSITTYDPGCLGERHVLLRSRRGSVIDVLKGYIVESDKLDIQLSYRDLVKRAKHLDCNELERGYEFLVHFSRTFTVIFAYLKGLYNKTNFCRIGRNRNGCKYRMS